MSRNIEYIDGTVDQNDHINRENRRLSFLIGGRYEVISDPTYVDFMPTHIVELLSPEYKSVYKNRGHLYKTKNLWVFNVHDITTPEKGLIHPTEELIINILKVAEKIKEDLKKGNDVRLLVNCSAGISRSTATTLIILVKVFPYMNYNYLQSVLLQGRPQAQPNPEFLRLFNKLERGY